MLQHFPTRTPRPVTSVKTTTGNGRMHALMQGRTNDNSDDNGATTRTLHMHGGAKSFHLLEFD